MENNQQLEGGAPLQAISRKKSGAKRKRTTAKASKKPIPKIVDPIELSQKSSKPKKPKLVRDSFTIPADEYRILAAVKKQLIAEGIEVKKTELIRIGLLLVSRSKTTTLKRHLNFLQKLKVGRPKKIA